MLIAALLSASAGRASLAAAKGDADSTAITNPAKPTSQDSACTMSFSDVHTSDYFYQPVYSLHCTGAISGYPDNTFRPNTPATRGQLAKIVVIAQGWPLVRSASPSFRDVPPGSDLYNYIETAKAHGAIAGYSDGTFRPNANITRAQITKITVAAQSWALASPGYQRFSDVRPDYTFYAYIETAVQHGLVSGYSDGTFRPGNVASRGQIAKIVYGARSSFQPTAQEQQTVNLVNQRRAALGLGLLRVNTALNKAARAHSYDIGPAGLCQHNSTNGTSPWDRIAHMGYGGFAMGEVVGCGYTTPQDVVDGWWNSPAHHAILVDPSANDVGCGWWIGSNGIGLQTCDTGRSQ